MKINITNNLPKNYYREVYIDVTDLKRPWQKKYKKQLKQIVRG